MKQLVTLVAVAATLTSAVEIVFRCTASRNRPEPTVLAATAMKLTVDVLEPLGLPSLTTSVAV